MSVQGAVISNLDGLVFNKGYMYGTRSGGAADQIAWGALQNVTLQHDFATVEINGPEAMTPLAVAFSGETLGGTFDHGVIHPEQMTTVLGGSMAVSGTDTIYTKLTTQTPLPFDLHFESGPSAQDDLDIRLYNCLMPSWSLRMDDKAFAIGSNSFRVYGQSAADGSRLFTVTKPGNLTNSS